MAKNMDEKVWLIWIEGNQEGPYTIQELKHDTRLTPDTLVWKDGFSDWKAIRSVEELKAVFEDEPESKPLLEAIKIKTFEPELTPEQDTLALQTDPSQFYLWMLVLLLLAVYLFYQLYHSAY